MTPKRKAIAKNVSIHDLLRALSQLHVDNVDIEIHQYEDMPNKLIIKPISKQQSEDEEVDNIEDEDSTIPDDIDDNIQDSKSDVKDLLDLI